MNLTGYSDPLSVRAGEAVSFMLGADQAGSAQVRLVRLLHGDTNPLGPGFVEREVGADLPRTVEVGPQATRTGSYAVAEDPSGQLGAIAERGTLYAFIRPSMVGEREQAIAGAWDWKSNCGVGLFISAAGCLTLKVGNGTSVEQVSCSERMAANVWYFVAGGWDVKAGTLHVWQRGRINRWNSVVGLAPGYQLDDAKAYATSVPSPIIPRRFAVAAALSFDSDVGALFNGKIDRHGACSALLDEDQLTRLSQGRPPESAVLLAHWDTTAGYSKEGAIGDVIVDVGPHQLDAKGVNRPVRGMTGWNWGGRSDSARVAPEEYGAIGFHDDALTDCRWTPSLRFEVPIDLPSGVYALRVRMSGQEDHVPFFVSSAEPKAKLAVLMSTFTYLAYANERLAFDGALAEAVVAHTPVMSPGDVEWKRDQKFGMSTYDVHSDGGGVCYSSSRRPIQNLRPRYRMPTIGVPWALPADLSLIWWLDAKGYQADVITDHDLHRDGAALLAPYRAVVTVTHPEYHSEAMLNGIEDYLAGGGRVAYLGGNGFYWVTEIRPDEPWCIEIRRLESGTRGWQAAPGEAYLATTGERGGLWRARGRAPQKLVALGFTAEGMDESQPFERLPDSFDVGVSWIFEGIGAEELIGNFGLGLNGAAGLEVDRYDLSLGTPPHTKLLASSFGHSDGYQMTQEDIYCAFPGAGGTQNPMVRGDMAYFTTATGGAVFAVGSIAWSQALPCNGGDNNVSRVLQNVLNAFVHEDLPPNP
jgi:N,N-dimethylformamidase